MRSTPAGTQPRTPLGRIGSSTSTQRRSRFATGSRFTTLRVIMRTVGPSPRGASGWSTVRAVAPTGRRARARPPAPARRPTQATFGVGGPGTAAAGSSRSRRAPPRRPPRGPAPPRTPRTGWRRGKRGVIAARLSPRPPHSQDQGHLGDHQRRAEREGSPLERLPGRGDGRAQPAVARDLAGDPEGRARARRAHQLPRRGRREAPGQRAHHHEPRALGEGAPRGDGARGRMPGGGEVVRGLGVGRRRRPARAR